MQQKRANICLKLLVSYLSGDEESHETHAIHKIRNGAAANRCAEISEAVVTGSQDRCNATVVRATAWNPTFPRPPERLTVLQVFRIFTHMLCCSCIISTGLQ
jgi:hypothetical protein